MDERAFRYPAPSLKQRNGAGDVGRWMRSSVRANRPPTVEKLGEIIHKVIADRVACHQLDECLLTLHDLNLIASHSH